MSTAVEPSVLSSDIAVNSQRVGFKQRDQSAHRHYHQGISPDVAKLMKTDHFQQKVHEVIPHKRFATTVHVQISVRNDGSVAIREKSSDRWVTIYKKDELEETDSSDLDEPIDEIVKKTQEAFDGLFPDTDLEEEQEEPLRPSRITGSSPPLHHQHCCEHQHRPESLRPRDEIIEELRNEIRDLRREIRDLKASGSTPPTVQIAALDHGLKLTADRIDSLPDLDPTLLAQNEQLRRQQQEIHTLRQDLTQANKDKVALTLLLSAASQWGTSLQKQLREKSEDLQLTEETLQGALESYDELQRENTTLSRDLQERTHQLQQAFTLFLGTAGLYQHSQTTLESLKHEYAQLQSQNESLTQNLAERTEQLKKMTVLFVLAGGLYQQSQQEVLSLRDQLRDVNLEKERLSSRLEAANQLAETRRLALEDQASKHALAIKTLTSRAEDAEKEAHRLGQELEKVRLSEGNLSSEVKRLTPLYEEAHKQAGALRLELSQEKETHHLAMQDLQLRFNQAQDRVRELEPLLEKANKDVARLEELLQAQGLDLSRAKDEASEAQRQLRLAQAVHESDLEDLRNEHDAATEKLQLQNEETIRRLKSEHSDDLALKLKEQQARYDDALQKLEQSYKRSETQLAEKFAAHLERLELQVKDLGSQLNDATEKAERFEQLLESQAQEHAEELLRVKKDLSSQVEAASKLAEERRLALESQASKHVLALKELTSRAEGAERNAVRLDKELQAARLSEGELSSEVKRLTPLYEEARKQAEALKLELSQEKDKHRLAMLELQRQFDQAQDRVKEFELLLDTANKEVARLGTVLTGQALEVSGAKGETLEAQRQLKIAQVTHQEDIEDLRLEHEKRIEQLKAENGSNLALKLKEQQERYDEAFQELERSYNRTKAELVSEIRQLQNQATYWKKTAKEWIQKSSDAEFARDEVQGLLKLETEKAEHLQERSRALANILRDAQDKMSSVSPSLAEEMDESNFPGKHIGIRIDHLLMENSRLSEEMEELQQQLEDARLQHLTRVEELDVIHQNALRDQARQHEDRIRELDHSMKQGHAEVERLRLEKSRLLSEQLKSRDELQAITEARDELFSDWQKAETRNTSLEGTVERLRTKVSGLEQEIEGQKEALISENSEIVKRNKQIEGLERVVKDRDGQITQLESFIGELEVALDADYKESIKQRNLKEEALEHLEGSQKEVTRLNALLESKQKEFDEQLLYAQHYIDKITKQGKRAEAELSSQISNLEETLIERDARIKELEEENAQLKLRVKEQDREIRELREEALALRVENRELWAILRKLAVILDVQFDSHDLSGTSKRVLEGTERLIEDNRGLLETSLVAKKTIEQVAESLGIKTGSISAETLLSEIDRRTHELTRLEREVDLHRAEKERVMKELEEIQSEIITLNDSELEVPTVTPISVSPLKENPLNEVAQNITRTLGTLLRGIGNQPVYIRGLNSGQREVLTFNQEALLHPERLPKSVQQKTDHIVAMSNSKAKASIHSGFNAIIYNENGFLDFIDRLQGFLNINGGDITQIDRYQQELQELGLIANRLTMKGTGMSIRELKEAQQVIREIRQIQQARQKLVEQFFSNLLNAIRLDSTPGINPYTEQMTTGRGFRYFAKDLIAYLNAFSQLDPSFYVAGDRRNPLISSCEKAQDFRALVESINMTLTALFGKVRAQQ